MVNLQGQAVMDEVAFIFFDIGYTLVDERLVWRRRCIEQSQTEEAKLLGLTPQSIYEEILKASAAYQPQFRTVIRKYGLTDAAPYRHEYERLYKGARKVLKALCKKYKLGVIANQQAGLENRLSKWGIRKYFL